MAASVLDPLSGAACDHVLGRTHSAAVLAALARENVPLAAIDRSHESYRLHGLLAEMLRMELRRNRPELVPALHRAASDWYLAHGEIDLGLDHARSAGDLDRVGGLLWAHLPGYLGRGRGVQVHGWLAGITPEHAAGTEQALAGARLALAAAHSSLTLGRASVAEQWARTATVRLSAVSEALTGAERAGVLLIEAWTARSGTLEMAELAARGYELLPQDSPWRASCCVLRGSAALLRGEHAEAGRWLEEGAARGEVVAPDAASLALAQLAIVAWDSAQPAAASDLARRACVLLAEHDLSTTPICALVVAVGAAAALREGRVDDAKAAACRCRTLVDELDDALAWLGAQTRIVLARVSLALGDVPVARMLLADASRLARRTPDVVLFGRWFDEAWGQFDERAESALAEIALLTTAELRVLRFLPTHYSFHEIAQRLHVSSNTVKTHVHAVYRKLNASSRSEAVARATRAGLLGSSVPSGAAFEPLAGSDQSPSQSSTSTS